MHTSETSSVVRRFAIDLVILLTCLAANLMGGGSPAAEVTTPEAVAAELGYDLAQPLSIHQCIQIALRVHPDIRVAVAELEQATASLQQARAALWPAFTGSIDYRVTDQPTRTAVVGGSLIPVGGGRSTARNAQISGYYSLYESGRFQTIRRARAYRDAAVAGLEDAKRRLAYLVTQAYFDRLVAERLVAVKEASILAAQEHVNQVQARINAGEAAPVEIHAVRAQLHAAQLDLSSARTQ
ncbi:MAG: TolC family protein, partial [Candidatus Zipacnadales bacterium]